MPTVGPSPMRCMALGETGEQVTIMSEAPKDTAPAMSGVNPRTFWTSIDSCCSDPARTMPRSIMSARVAGMSEARSTASAASWRVAAAR